MLLPRPKLEDSLVKLDGLLLHAAKRRPTGDATTNPVEWARYRRALDELLDERLLEMAVRAQGDPVSHVDS